MLREKYPKCSTASVAEQMGLTTQQVSNYAKTRKLKKSDEYKLAEKNRIIDRLMAAKQRAEQCILSMSEAEKASIIRLQTKPCGTQKRTAHGTAYTIGNVTTHVMR